MNNTMAPPIKADSSAIRDIADRHLPPAVELRSVRKSFKSTIAVGGIDFSVPPGSLTTLLGASGSGKTTTLRLIAGLESVDSGEVRIKSQIVDGVSTFVPPERRRLGLVPQSYALWPHMSVFDQVAYPLKVRGERNGIRDRVQRALDLVGLDGLEARLPAELSGGQQQRVAVARAIVYEPDVLLLDEPLSNLDLALRDRMRQELRKLHERIHLAMVYVTHDQIEALSLSDQIIVMQNGSIICQGTPREIYEHPPNVETARFVGSTNILKGTVRSLSGTEASVQLRNGATITITAERASFQRGGGVLVGFKPEDVSLMGSAALVGEEHLHGEVESYSYLGSHTDVVVRVSDDETVRVLALGDASPPVGRRIALSIQRSRLRAFRPSGPK